MKVQDPPPPTYAFDYKNPPRSGNEINGLNQEEKTRARHVFHNATGESLPWNALDEFFSQINVWGVVKHMLANIWQLRRQDGPLREPQIKVEDPVAMTAEIKARARDLGIGLVGVTAMFDEALYEGYEVSHRYAICLGLPMDRKEMLQAPHERAAVEVMRAYKDVSRIAVELSEQIRAMGWPAKAYGNPNSADILHIPLAVRAGLGELGKHGSLISREYGSNFRLATVLTDLPLVSNEPVDLAVDDLCKSCRRCVVDCPPGAIFNEKQLVRGEKKWYVDFDKCIPYFVKTYGCAICIEVCPWSEPGRGPNLVEKLMARREKQHSEQERR